MGVETFPVLTTRKDAVIAWGQKNSLWPMPFGTACCAIEFMGVVSSVFDLARFGAELVRFPPAIGPPPGRGNRHLQTSADSQANL